MILPEPIEKFPIIVLASPRTGSNPFTHDLNVLYRKCKAFYEPEWSKDHWDEFLEFSKNNNNYIIKLMASSIPLYPKYVVDKLVDGTAYVFRLKRRNIIDQIASHYVARMRGIWCYQPTNKEAWEDLLRTPTDISIDLKEIDQSIKMVKYDIELVDDYDSDQTIFYEDMTSLSSADIKTPLPTNYQDVINAVSERYQ
jgi:hypothetical protein